MGSIKLGLNQNIEIKWPNFCAICNTQSTDWAKTSITNTTKCRYYVVTISFDHQTFSLLYPVCKKHKRLCNFLDIPYRISLLNNVLGFSFITAILWGILALLFTKTFAFMGLENLVKNTEQLSGMLVGGLVVFYFIYGLIYKPVKIVNMSEDSVELSMKNDKFLSEFMILNIKNVLR